MDRTTGANVDASSGVNKFKDGPPGTTVEQVWLNGIQEEMINVIKATDQTPTTSNDTLLAQSIAHMAVGMRNGKIVPSVAGNALTVAIKTLNGNDPSSTNPVYVKIGDNIRSITAALYVTLAGGTDDWDRTSYTYSLFVYLGWDSTNSRVEILLNPMPMLLTYPAANPAAPNPLRTRSAYGSNSATAIASGHAVQNIGRIDGVAQSAADNYTAVTATNVLSYPCFWTPWLASPEVPSRSNAADTTPVFTTNTHYYSLHHNICTESFYFFSDGGVDGLGAAGNIALVQPFVCDLNGANPVYADIGNVLAANYDGGWENYLAGQLLATLGTLSHVMLFRAGAIVAGAEVTAMTPAMFTNGNRYILGNVSYAYDITP